MAVKNPILAILDQEPALLVPGRRAWFESCIEQTALEMSAFEAEAADATMSDDFWYEEGSGMERYRPYLVVNGVLQIPVKGSLLKDFPYTTRWATGYDYIWKAFKRGIDDSAVKAIALVIDSPGGMVAGCFELVDKMYEIREAKPVRAFASDYAYSAAYAIASVAQSGISVTRTGGVGSVGVVTMHVDWSKWNADYGVAITYIFAGDHKVDGNPDEPLSKDAKARIQERIDSLYNEFVSTVARNRDMDEQAIRDTEALTFTAQEAVSNGMADSIGAFDDTIAAFAAETSKDEGNTTMSTDNPTAVDQAAVDNAKAEGTRAERTRVNAILGCEAAKSRPKAALSAALKTDMSAESAAEFLADLPEEAKTEAPKAETPAEVPTAGAPQGLFEAAMNGSGNPGIDSGAGSDDTEMSNDDAVVDRILADSGRGRRKSA
jgi:signal peptide peptidase SppA